MTQPNAACNHINDARVASEMRSAALLEFFTMEQNLRAAARHLAAAEAIAAEEHAEPSDRELGGDSELTPAGLEPATCGLEGRCSSS